MAHGREAVPAVEVEPEEDGLDEEGKPFGRKGQPDDAAGVAHEAGPEQSQLEGEDRAGDGADGEEDGESFGPAAGEGDVDRVAGRSQIPSAMKSSTGSPMPSTAKMMWKASEVPIWARAARRLDKRRS